MQDSTKAAPFRKAFRKPRPDFPLFPHATGRWAKKVRGKFHYFGRCAEDPGGVAALELWLEQKDDLLAGRKPRTPSNGLTLRHLCNHFLTNKESRVESGELSARTFAGYQETCQRLIGKFGKLQAVDDLRPEDFAAYRTMMAKRWGPVGLGTEVTVVRMIFKFAFDYELIEKPVRFGPDFKRPSKMTLRKERASKGTRLFTAEQIRDLMAASSMQMRAMILMGINCGFGNSDLGNLPIEAIDLKAGWVDYPRPKTGIHRRCKLWPETVTSIETVLKSRPSPKIGAEGLLFITKYGQPWAKSSADSPITKETRKLLDQLGIYRPGLSFYALRHTFETIGGETTDQVAVNAIMGHVDNSMAAVYRERISDERLEAVAEHVRKWLFPDKI